MAILNSRKTFTFVNSAAAALFLSVPAVAEVYLSLAEAQKVTFPEAERFEMAIIRFTPEEKKALEKRLDQKIQTEAQKVFRAYRGDQFLGFFILDYALGKHEYIDYAVALSPEGSVKDVEILTYRESYGWEIRDQHWRKQFVGKTSAANLQINKDISNIGGATLSCRHVTEGVKKVLAIYETYLQKK